MTTAVSASEGLDLRHVRKRYIQNGTALDVLDDISLRVRPGEFISILGSSGCGKSTLLRLIAGLDTDYSGEILAGGERVRDTSLQRGIVFQDHRLFPWLTASQNILAALRNAPLTAKQKRDAVAEHIALVGLTGFENAYPNQLSGGMRNAWRSRAGWSTGRVCCCSTNRSARSTRSPAAACKTNCNGSGSRSASR